MLERLAVDDVARHPALGERDHVLARVAPGEREALVREADRVGREDDVVEREQRIVRRDRLRLEDVERRAGDPALLQRRGEGGLVDDRASRDVDQERARLHQREPLPVDQAAGGVGERARDADEVRLAQQLLELDQLDALGRRDVGVGGGDPQLERLCEPRDLAADVAETDDPERPAPQTDADVREPLPAAFAQVAVLLEEPVGQRQDEREGGAGHRPADPVRRDREQHPVLRAGIDVDAVVADAEPRDEREPLLALDGGGGDPRREDDHGVVGSDGLRRQLSRVLGQELPGGSGLVQEVQVVPAGAVLATDVTRHPDPEAVVHGVSAPPGNTLRLLEREHAARCRVLGRPHIDGYGGSLRPCIAWCSPPRSSEALPGGALAFGDAPPVVLPDGMEDVEHSAGAPLRPGRVGNAAWDLVAVPGGEPVLDAGDPQHEHSVDDESELLVLVAVLVDDRPLLELEHVQHHGVTEQRLHPDARHQLVPPPGGEVDDLAHQPATTGFVRRSIPSTSTAISSPGSSQTGGFRNAPTPAGVPVETTSPGSSVTIAVRNSIRRAGGKIMSEVGDDCICSPFRYDETRTCCGSGISSGVTTSGPIGEKVSTPLPSVIWWSLNWMSRADTSFRTV